MKKFFIAAALVLGFAVVASAQPRAIGLRLGWGAEASYQHTVYNEDFVEVDLGLCTFDGLNASAVYNFMIAQPACTDRGYWGFYAGPGLAVGMGGLTTDSAYFNLGVAGQVGLEYTFWFPLQLSFDIRPVLGFGFNYGLHWSVMPAIGVRYRF